jgi:hypothetical protein
VTSARWPPKETLLNVDDIGQAVDKLAAHFWHDEFPESHPNAVTREEAEDVVRWLRVLLRNERRRLNDVSAPPSEFGHTPVSSAGRTQPVTSVWMFEEMLRVSNLLPRPTPMLLDDIYGAAKDCHQDHRRDRIEKLLSDNEQCHDCGGNGVEGHLWDCSVGDVKRVGVTKAEVKMASEAAQARDVAGQTFGWTSKEYEEAAAKLQAVHAEFDAGIKR